MNEKESITLRLLEARMALYRAILRLPDGRVLDPIVPKRGNGPESEALSR